MSHEEDQGAEPTQVTAKGAKIPVPTREAFMQDLAKVAPPVEREPDDKREPPDGRTDPPLSP